MSLEQEIVVLSAAVVALTAKIDSLLSGTAVNVNSKPSDEKATDPVKNGSAEQPEPLYYHNPKDPTVFGVTDEAQFKVLKKATPALVKTTKAKYDKLVEAASAKPDTGDNNERVQAIIDALPSEPTEEEISNLFLKYIPADAGEERTTRINLIKPILVSVNAKKASAVAEGDRYDVMVQVVQAVEAYLEETDQVQDEENDDLV